jgi:hypothetical protein
LFSSDFPLISLGRPDQHVTQVEIVATYIKERSEGQTLIILKLGPSSLSFSETVESRISNFPRLQIRQ